MPTTFRPCAPDQSLLFPPSPRDWLPDGHLAFFIADTVAVLNLHALDAPYEGDGRRNQPFDPQMMVTVLLYAYATEAMSYGRRPASRVRVAVLSFRCFSLRGVVKARAEWNIVCLAVNLKRLHRIQAA